MKTQITITPQAFSKCSHNINLYFLFLSLTLITACSLFKEKTFFLTDSLHRHNIRKEFTQESAKKTESLSFYSSTDSADRQTTAEIFPRGPFNYSLSGGFTGEAERVLINERVQKRRQVQVSEQLQETNELKSAMKESERKLAKARQKEKEVQTSNLNLWMFATCALSFALIFLIARLKWLGR